MYFPALFGSLEGGNQPLMKGLRIFGIYAEKKEFIFDISAKLTDDFIIAHDAKERDELWYARRNASPSFTIFGSKKLNEDISVPRSMLPKALKKIYEIGAKYGFDVPCFGHAGDGNIHVNVMVDGSNEKQLKDGHKAIEEIFQLVVDMGGTLSGEHGIGTSKAPFMHIAFNDAELSLFKSIKLAFDPNNILNPGKMGLENL